MSFVGIRVVLLLLPKPSPKGCDPIQGGGCNGMIDKDRSLGGLTSGPNYSNNDIDLR